LHQVGPAEKPALAVPVGMSKTINPHGPLAFGAIADKPARRDALAVR